MNPIFLQRKLAGSINRSLRSPFESFTAIRVLAPVLMLVILLGLIGFSGCTSKQTAAPNAKTPVVSNGTATQNNLVLLQNNKGCSARFYGMMTFNAFNQEFTYPTELKLLPMAITWMGPIFNGRLETKGQGAAIYEVHGSASADGNWIETMYYSVNTFQPNSQYGLFYRVTLRNLHLIAPSNNAASWAPVFELAGSEVQKYVAKIEYTGSSQYLSIDWQTDITNQRPTLRVEFIKDAPVQTNAPAGGGGM
jgi:hypothetical protein